MVKRRTHWFLIERKVQRKAGRNFQVLDSMAFKTPLAGDDGGLVPVSSTLIPNISRLRLLHHQKLANKSMKYYPYNKRHIIWIPTVYHAVICYVKFYHVKNHNSWVISKNTTQPIVMKNTTFFQVGCFVQPCRSAKGPGGWSFGHGDHNPVRRANRSPLPLHRSWGHIYGYTK